MRYNEKCIAWVKPLLVNSLKQVDNKLLNAAAKFSVGRVWHPQVDVDPTVRLK
jgi:hypothetical protein